MTGEIAGSDLLKRIRDIVSTLSPLHRDILLALMSGEVDGADEELALRHGVPLAMVRSERWRAQARLREILLHKQ